MNAYFRTAVRVLVAALLLVGLLLQSVEPVVAAGGQTGNVSGTVIDGATKLPVAGVVVSLAAPSGRYEATTDAKGAFVFLGATLDTFTLSLTMPGYETFSEQGITVLGDQTVDLGKLVLSKPLKTVANVTARSRTSAYQPSQTVDNYTFSGDKLDQALGKKFNTDQTELVSASPGVQVDTAGNLSVRGGLAAEVGLQLDGVDNTQVSHLRINTTFLNGINSLSVVPGAGDPSQGNAGSGVVNLIPKRGASPAFGTLDLETGTQGYYHQFGLEYGWATPDGRFSNYTSFTGVRDSLLKGPPGTPAALVSPGYYTGVSYERDNDVLNNFIYKFGRNKHESLQLLLQTRFTAQDADLGGYLGLPYGQFSPYSGRSAPALSHFGVTYDPAGGASDDASLDQLLLSQHILPLLPGQTSYTATASGPTPAFSSRSSLFKLEYDNNLNATTYLATRFYNTGYIGVLNDPYGTQESAATFGLRTANNDGGRRSGISSELNKSLGEKNTLTIGAKYETARPVFDFIDHGLGLLVTEIPQRRPISDMIDFLRPPNPNAPLTFPTLNLDGTIATAGTNDCPAVGGCWLYYTGKFPAGVAIPPFVISSPPNPIQYWDVFARDQLKVNDRLRLDLGLREDGANFHLPQGIVTGNVGPDAATNTPRFLEPRLAASFEATRADAIRFSFGRSIEYVAPAGLYAFTSFAAYNAFNNVPIPDPTTNSDPNVRAGRFAPIGAVCGSGEDLGQPPPYAVPLRHCTSYSDFLHWEMDNLIKPDNGNALTTTYSNLELSYSHLFKGGFGLKLTPFYKRGFNIPLVSVVAYAADPITGGLNPITYRNAYTGISKTTGLEMLLTSPERRYGLSGFLSATYINELGNKPAGISGEDLTPVVAGSVFSSGNIYRAGFLAPFIAVSGLSYKFKNGFRIAPTITFDGGQPIGSGLLTPILINNVALNVPHTNASISFPVQNNVSAGIVTQYIDPTNPGTLTRPNFAATRGTPEASSPGGILSKPRLNANLALEYSHARNTFGVRIENLFDRVNDQPSINTNYQPVATGVAGPLTGYSPALASPAAASYGIAPGTLGSNAFGAYVVPQILAPLTYRMYFQRSL